MRLSATSISLLVAAAVAGSRRLSVSPGVSIHLAIPFSFAALVLDGTPAAVLVALGGETASRLGWGQENGLIRSLATYSAVVLSMLGAGQVFGLLARPGLGQPIEQASVAALVASLACFLLNGWLLAIPIALSTRASWIAVWSKSLRWSAPAFLASGAMGVVIADMAAKLSIGTVFLTLPFSLMIYQSYRSYAARHAAEQRRLETIERLNAELEDKVRQRTESLQALNGELKASNTRLAEANRLKSEFLANVSHELRTPLNAIIGFSDLLKSEAAGNLSEEQNEFIQDIHVSGKNLLALINEILDLAKIEAGKMAIHPEAIHPRTLATDARGLVAVLARNQGIDLKVELAEELRDVDADPMRIRQVLWNLLSNAIKFTPAGGTVELRVRRDGDHVAFAVADTGIGMSPEDLQRIFEPFVQIDGSHARRHSGTGLGLAIARRFVELHGSRLEVESRVGEGSCFSFRLPVFRNVPENVPAEREAEVPA